MPLKNRWILIAAIALIVVVASAALYEVGQFQSNHNTAEDREALFQIAPFNTFSEGNYDGNTTYAELSKHGNFGIGTLNGLNGEMIALNGVFYHIPSDGKVRQIGFDEEVPYATVTYFDADQTIQVTNALNYSELMTYITGFLPSQNAIYAIKVHGVFEYAKTRSPQLQQKPYVNLTEAIKSQSVFTLNNVNATAAGFWFPSSMNGVDYAGYHLHLITDNHDAGGHMLECIVKNAVIEIDQTNKYTLTLP